MCHSPGTIFNNATSGFLLTQSTGYFSVLILLELSVVSDTVGDNLFQTVPSLSYYGLPPSLPLTSLNIPSQYPLRTPHPPVIPMAQ